MHGKANIKFRIVVILEEKEGNMIREVRGSQGSIVKKKVVIIHSLKKNSYLKTQSIMSM